MQKTVFVLKLHEFGCYCWFITLFVMKKNYQMLLETVLFQTSCVGGRHNMPPPPANWPLTFWPWKCCPSHVWRGLRLCQF